MNMRKQERAGFKWLAMGLMAWATSVAAQTPVLNELMASNDLAHYDDFFEFDDWVELYNPAACFGWQAITSDDPDSLTKYTIPDTDPGDVPRQATIWSFGWLRTAPRVLHANRIDSENEGWFTLRTGSPCWIPVSAATNGHRYGRSCDGCRNVGVRQRAHLRRRMPKLEHAVLHQ